MRLQRMNLLSRSSMGCVSGESEMSNELTPKRVSGELIHTQPRDAQLHIDPPLSGIPLFNRMRYRSMRKELDEYFSVLDRKEAIIRKLASIAEANEGFATGLVRLERLDDLRQATNHKIDEELNRAAEGAVQSYRDAAANAVAHRIRMANLEAEALAAEKQLDALRNPPAPPAPAAQVSPAERMASEVRKLREQEQHLIVAIAGDGDEATWSDDVRELVSDIRLATRNHLANLVDGLNR
jgi:seryl-tRNA synthetase